jgi:hypothetical protein
LVRKKLLGGKFFFGSDAIGASTSNFGITSGSGTSPSNPSSLSTRTNASVLLQAASIGAGLGIVYELTSYLDGDIVN